MNRGTEENDIEEKNESPLHNQAQKCCKKLWTLKRWQLILTL
jgi:hypothetical protein